MPRSKSERARAEMIMAAHDIIREVGIHNVTLASIVKRSGVAKTTFYRHFKSISELVICSADAHVVEPDIPDTGSLRQDLFELSQAVVPVYSEPENRQLLTSLIHASAKDPALRELHDRTMDSRTKPLETIVLNAMKRGELPVDIDVELAAHFIQAPFFERVLCSDQELTLDETNQILDWICRGLNFDETKATNN